MGKQIVEQPAWKQRFKSWNRTSNGTSKAYKRSHWTQPWYYDYPMTHLASIDEGYVLGTDIPYFHRMKKAGQLIPHTSFVLENQEGSVQKAVWVIQTNVGGDTTGNMYDPYYAWFSVFRPRFDQLTEYCSFDDGLIQRAAAKIYSSGWDASTFLAELGPSVRMFRAIGDKLSNINRLKRNSGIKSTHNNEDLSNWWLEARYGWRPLISDLKKFAETFGDWSSKFYRANERARYQHEKVTSTESSQTYYFGTVHFLTTDYLWYSKTGSLTADLLASSLNLSLMMTAWEKIPYSFVLEWMIQVGQLISAVCFDDWALRTTSSAGYACRLRRHVVAQNFVPAAGYFGSVDVEMSYEISRKERAPMRVPYMPQTRVKLDLYKIIDTIFLLKQLKGDKSTKITWRH